ncbi:hypothetical protein Ddc_15132 [Ditylenchus destructor]|nr:hypothetical protein Ddc_15132 [Ditylenchus destructor]
MLPNHVLLDILKCMNRTGLAKIQETTQVINGIIKRDFGSKPLHIFDDTYGLKIRRNEKNEILVGFYRDDTDNDNMNCFIPSIRGLQECKMAEECCHFYSIDVMRPFLGYFIRYMEVTIEIDNVDNGLPPYTSEQISFLESISHIWADQTLSIEDYVEKHVDYNLKGILGSSAILPCHSLKHFKCPDEDEIKTSIVMAFQQCSNLYSLPTVYFSCPILKNDILRLIHYKAAYPQSDTTLVLYDGYMSGAYNDWLYLKFLTSSVPCRLRVIIEILLLCSASKVQYNYLASLQPESFQYRLENNRTKEVLQLNQITKQEAKEKFDVALYQNAVEKFQNNSFTEGTDGKALILERFTF